MRERGVTRFAWNPSTGRKKPIEQLSGVDRGTVAQSGGKSGEEELQKTGIGGIPRVLSEFDLWLWKEDPGTARFDGASQGWQPTEPGGGRPCGGIFNPCPDEPGDDWGWGHSCGYPPNPLCNRLNVCSGGRSECLEREKCRGLTPRWMVVAGVRVEIPALPLSRRELQCWKACNACN